MINLLENKKAKLSKLYFCSDNTALVAKYDDESCHVWEFNSTDPYSDVYCDKIDVNNLTIQQKYSLKLISYKEYQKCVKEQKKFDREQKLNRIKSLCLDVGLTKKEFEEINEQYTK